VPELVVAVLKVNCTSKDTRFDITAKAVVLLNSVGKKQRGKRGTG
jgi:hypothetical protein